MWNVDFRGRHRPRARNTSEVAENGGPPHVGQVGGGETGHAGAATTNSSCSPPPRELGRPSRWPQAIQDQVARAWPVASAATAWPCAPGTASNGDCHRTAVCTNGDISRHANGPAMRVAVASTKPGIRTSKLVLLHCFGRSNSVSLILTHRDVLPRPRSVALAAARDASATEALEPCSGAGHA